MSDLNLSFIIPAFNEEKLLPETLKCIRQSASVLTDKGLEWEIVVCDNLGLIIQLIEKHQRI